MVYAMTHMLFGCVAWGHSFGATLQLRNICGSSSIVKLDALHHAVLQWAIAAPPNTCSAAIYIMMATIPLHGLILK